MRIGKRAASSLAIAACLFAAAPAAAMTSIVVDVATGKVLSESAASQRWYPASTTKLMTAYVALKALETKAASLDTPVVITRFAAGQAPSKMGFPPGSVMRLDVALRMMLVKSANDVAVAIATALGDGSVEAFVGRMNEAAAALGMRDTHFVNPNGLPGEGQHSSAKDLAILAARIRTEFPAFTDLFGTEAISTGTTTIRNTNPLLGRYDGADGMKTGYICASGFNLVGSATRNGRTLVAVLLGASGPIVRDRIIADLLEAGFRTDPAASQTLVTALPEGGGAPADISREICSAEGQKERAVERQAEAKRPEHNSGSPFLHEMARPPSVVPLALGGAAGTADIPPGATLIAAYGIPIPTARPDPAVPEVPADPQTPLPPGASSDIDRADEASRASAAPVPAPEPAGEGGDVN
ncbi:D-alanyl-D-alanine carboxypeptidase [Aureimonas endophytica]|uniref:D-alanyl-D-alanine carboxypeptidase n=1 Tax=Aureimonas endophytica TaxID=2027858 RepID=A0A916ZTY1_9HYPH|nr:D-alanyl-D-alanine carboxypeptidase family protein [Aureimonas endophytica]GGE14045.1 D-alanyl-D-alanine carboxypeptidase [Aureimonas endophytica]